MLIYLSNFDIGIWLIFIAIGGVNQLIEMGFQPVISRNIGYVLSGAQFLKKNGSPGNIDKKNIRYDLLYLIYITGKSIYLKITILSGLIGAVFGTIYISIIINELNNQYYYYLSWLLFTIGGLITLKNGLNIAYLSGNGFINHVNYSLILNRLIYLILGGLGLVFGFGILGLSISYLFASIISGLFIKKQINKINIISKDYIVNYDIKKLGKILIYSSSRYGVAGIGSFLLQKGNVLVASSFLGAAGASSYALTNSILLSISTIVLGLSNAQMPIINQLAAAKKYVIINYRLKLTLLLGIAIYLSIFFIIFFYGDSFINYIGSKTQILGGSELILFGIVILLELNHSICSTFITSKNIVPFVKAGIYSGILATLLSIAFAEKYGIIAIILSHGFAQLLYNNWKWPKLAFRLFKDKI